MMEGSTRCNCCPRQVRAAEARLCLRACKEVLCWQCRLKKYPVFPNAHAAPKDCSVTLAPSGYGLFTCVLTTPDGRTFSGGGMSDALALSRARQAAVQAGAIQ